MYDNPKHIKKHPIKSRYDDFEHAHVARMAERRGEQIATFQRNATLIGVAILESLGDDQFINIELVVEEFNQLKQLKRGA